MRRRLTLISLLLTVSLQVLAQNQYRAIENYLHVPEANNITLGQVVGLAVDANDDLYVFHRAGRVWDLEIKDPLRGQVVCRFNKRGKYLGGDEAPVTLPHMIEVDAEGHLWLVDVSQQQVFFMGPSAATFGKSFEPGNDALHFNLPTDVSVLPDGSFYVSDGYRNSRVIKFSKEGKYQFEWGKKGNGDGEFNIPHSVKYFNGKVYVADRENSRLQVFDPDGRFLSKYDVGEKIGRLFAVTVDRKGNIYLSGMKEEGGGTLILSPDMKIKAELNTGGHDIAVDSKGAVYVTKGNNVTKFVPK
ncbi:MAG TPA: peptidyl-alpha-hydroxyglycine alpha-amidating lyase family protein [Cyclobacteriaceae bacterium]|nr:peptidyl-alpha-hydroxyglycine alpha-amidating lyase family protein [Cyclobacteriaceae bacterium]